MIAEAIGAGLEWLDPPRVERLCSCYGIPLGDARADGTDGVGMFAGVATDPHFGPVVACGPVGSALELVRDVAVRLAPLTDRDAHEMLRSLQTFPLLDGWRGAPKADAKGKYHALLVGVSEYPGLEKQFKLEGPANDVLLMRDFLTKSFGYTLLHE